MSFLIAHLSHMNKLLKEYKQDQLTTTNPSTSTKPHVLKCLIFLIQIPNYSQYPNYIYKR